MAEKAEQIEKNKQQLLDTIQEYKEKLETASDEDKKRIQKNIDDLREQLKVLKLTMLAQVRMSRKKNNVNGCPCSAKQ